MTSSQIPSSATLSEQLLDELPLIAQAGPAGLALAVDEVRRDVDAERDELPGLGLGEDLEPELDPLVGGTWRFEYPDHIQLIEKEVVEAIARSHQRLVAGEWEGPEILLVEVPPRHGKSTLISEHTPAWFIGTFPDRRVILCSCEADFAQTWGAKARDLLEEFGPSLFGVRVSQKSKAAKRWDIDRRRGGMITAGVMGRITGSGAHLMIIDDPTKNAEEAMSETIRDKHLDWWLSTARTRIEPGGVVVILMTRWHEGDLGGQVLRLAAEGGDPVREIRLPALAEKDDPLGRKPGEALWPARFGTKALQQIKKVLGPYWWAAMFQGKPTPDEGGIFARKYFRYATLEGAEIVLHREPGDVERFHRDWCTKVSYVDLAASEKETADYTVRTLAWVTPKRDLVIRSVIRERIPGPDQVGFLRDHHQGESIKVEEIGYQSTLIQSAVRAGLPVSPVYPDKDKVTRAGAAGALYRQGKVFHMKGAEWLEDFEAELLAFPAGEHDDQVDTVAYAARDLPNVRTTAPKRKRERKRPQTAGLLKEQF
jgi:predicted phage terminase large subunit-like protein